MPTLTQPKSRIPLPLEEIAALCRKYDVEELAVFGSVLRDDFGPNSDVDFLVTFRNKDAGPWGEKLVALEADLSRLLCCAVDVVTRGGIERSRNWVIRRRILSSTEVIYGP